MEPPNDNQDPMSYKAMQVACQLVESTERFLATGNEIQKSISVVGDNPNDYIKGVIQQYEHVCMIANVLQSISSFISTPQSRNSLSTAATSAVTTSSASLSRTYSVLLTMKIDNPAAQESLGQLGLLVEQARIVNVNVKVEDKNNNNAIATQESNPSSSVVAASSSPVDQERRELDRKRKLFEEEKQEFERERKRVLLDKEHTVRIQQQLKEQQESKKHKMEHKHQQLVVQQQQRQQQQQQEKQRKAAEQRTLKQKQLEKEKLDKQKQQIHILSTGQFLEQFEKTAQSFAESINMNIDSVWESMLQHALPEDKWAWAEENIIGKNLAWSCAKQMYSEKYAQDHSPKIPENKPIWPQPASPVAALHTSPSFPPPALKTTAAPLNSLAAVPPTPRTAVHPLNLPATPTAAFAATNAVVNASRPPTESRNSVVKAPRSLAVLSSAANPGPSQKNEHRVADYCQHLLSLQMKFYDTIEEYNQRYMRYCIRANVDLSGKTFIDRYIRSLTPKYSELIRAALRLSAFDLNNIQDAMALTENVINQYLASNPSRGNSPYSQNCVHNRNINQKA